LGILNRGEETKKGFRFGDSGPRFGAQFYKKTRKTKMKKVMIAAMAASVLAGSVFGAESAAQNVSRYTAAAGYSSVGDKGSAAVMLQAETMFNGTIFGGAADFSENFTNIVGTARVTPAVNISYVGAGYLDTYRNDIASTGPVPGSLDPHATMTTYPRIAKQGFYGIIGLADSVMVDDYKIGADVGYRIGEVNGPTFSIMAAKNFGTQTEHHIVGIKGVFDQVKHDTKDMNRVGMYLTYSF
jgi:hypothetical protein